ncbi:MAG: hypothetical protein R3E42_00435 [Burkholderiaceae bacterium]
MASLGPILQFLGNQNHTWGVSLLLTTAPGEAPPMLQLSAPAQASPPVSCPIPGHTGTAWRIDIAVPQAANDLAIDYKINGTANRFHVPPRDSSPNMGYVSCNGFSDPRVKKSLKEPQALWSRLGRLHRQIDRVDSTAFGPLHLLLMGGDQIYSDDLDRHPGTARLDRTALVATHRRPFTASMHSALQAHYARLYIDHWIKANRRPCSLASPP